MARIDLTGAELGGVFELSSTTVGNGGVFESSTTQKRTGARSWRAVRAGATVGQPTYGEITLAPTIIEDGVLTVFFGLFIPSGTAASDRVIVVPYGTGETAYVYCTHINSTTYAVTGGIENTVNSNEAGPSANVNYGEWVWVRLEVKHAASADDTVTIWLNSETNTATATGPRLTAHPAAVRFGLLSSTAASDQVFIDDLIVDFEVGATVGARMHPARGVYCAKPATDVGTPGWTEFGGSGTTNADKVGDGVDTSGVRATGSTGQVDRYLCTDLPTTSVLPPGSFPVVAGYGLRDVRTAAATGGAFHYILHSYDNNTEVHDNNLNAPLVVATRRNLGGLRTVYPDGSAFDNSGTFDGYEVELSYNNGQLATAGVEVREAWVNVEITHASAVTDALTSVDRVDVRGRIRPNDETGDALTVAETTDVRGRIRPNDETGDALTVAEDAQERGRVAVDDTVTMAEPDAPDVRGGVAVTDASTSTETAQERAGVAVTDARAVAEDAPTRVRFDLADTVDLAEQTPDVRGGVALTDARAVAETTDVRAGVAVPDPLTSVHDAAVRARQAHADTVTLTDAQDVRGGVTVSDPLTSNETPDVRGGVAVTDALTVAETPDVRGGVAVTDALTVAEDAQERARAALTDDLTVAETPQVRARQALTDALTMADAQDVRGGVAVTDALTVAETPQERAGVALTDAPTVAETAQERGRVAVTDTVTMADAQDVRARAALTDTVGTTEATPSVRGGVALTDAPTVAETAQERAGVPLTDALTADEYVERTVRYFGSSRVQVAFSVISNGKTVAKAAAVIQAAFTLRPAATGIVYINRFVETITAYDATGATVAEAVGAIEAEALTDGYIEAAEDERTEATEEESDG